MLATAVNPRNTIESKTGGIYCTAVPFGLDPETRTIRTAEESGSGLASSWHDPKHVL